MQDSNQSNCTPNIEDIYPLSPMQEGMLFHTLLHPSSSLYLGQVRWELEGSLDLNAVRRTWQELIARHPIFRTAFVWDGLDRPLQVIERDVNVPLDVQDWRALTPDEQKTRLEEYLDLDRRRGFTLTSAPLMRIAILRMSDSLQHFIWSQHHLLLDGWSALLILKEMLVLYAAYASGEAPDLPPVRPYRDYIAWLSMADLNDTEQYWRQALDGARPTILQLYSVVKDAPRVRGEYKFSMPRMVTQASTEMARKYGLTLSTLAQGAWAVALSRYTCQADVTFGGTVSGRNAPLTGIESMVGVFVNTLPVRARIDNDRRAVEWLAEFQREQAKTRRHEHAPLASVQVWSGIAGNPTLFDTLLSVQNLHIDLQADGAATNSRRRARGGIQVKGASTFENPDFPLSVTLGIGQEMVLVATYDQARFPPPFVRRFIQNFGTLFHALVSNPEALLGGVPMQTESELKELVAQSNGTVCDRNGTPFLHELITAQARRTPDAIAVTFEDERLSYNELERSARILANVLRQMGVRAERLVGVCLERSLEMVFALLGILKSGAAYVPLDPEYPDERLDTIVRDSGLSVIVTSRKFKTRFSAPCAFLYTEDLQGQFDGAEGGYVTPVAGDGLIYVIYTSGSTGHPKGAMNTHSAVTNRILWMQEQYGLSPFEKVLQKTPFSFDVSVWEFFWPLAVGATVVMLAPSAHRDPHQIISAVTRRQISTIHFVPSMLREFLEHPSVAECKTLERVICSGEALGTAVAEKLKHLLPCRAYNLYGPTEAAVDVTHFEFMRSVENATVPIGRPIANVEAYVLDPDMRLSPDGMAGELYIGGMGLGRGYVNRPEWTAEKFTPSPFSSAPGARLYRSGDLVRRLEDGDLEFLRRIDTQVKIRGNRVELGEIETVLNEQAGVEQAVVVARSAESGDQQLVAYIVGLPGAKSINTSGLRAALELRLPSYMIPQAFVTLQKLPLSANGKVDRTALPAPGAERSSVTSKEYALPRSATEEILAGLWARILSCERIGRTDNFFDLGGQSLLGMQVISRVRATFAVDLPLRALYRSPTVELLAREIEESRGQAPAPPIVPVGREGDLPLSFAQERLWLVEQLRPGSVAYNLPFALRLRGDLDRDMLQISLQNVVNRHEIMRTIFLECAGNPVQRVLPELRAGIEEIDLAGFDESARQQLALQRAQEDATRPFQLSAGPMFRAKLLRLSDRDHVLLFTIHHIISDAWSMAILARELREFYEARLGAGEHRLQKLQLQYGDYAAWQRARVDGSVLEAQLKYWERKLAQATPLDLPTDYARSGAASDSGDAVPLSLPEDLTSELKRLTQSEGVTLFMVLLAAWQVVLSKYTGQEDIVVGTGFSNRTQVELEALMGFFVTTLALRTQVRNDKTFKQLIAEVRETVLEAYEHSDVPFERAIDRLTPGAAAENSALLRVMLILQNAPHEVMGRRGHSGLQVSPVFETAPSAKQELSLHLWESEGRLDGSAIYKTALFTRLTIEKLLDGLRSVISTVCSEGVAVKIGEISLIDEFETAQAVEDFTGDLNLAEA